MKIYHYDKIMGEYIGQTDARKSPLDDEWLIPANSTSIVPPDEVKVGYALCFINGEWQSVEDHRGETVYTKSDASVITVSTIGPISPDYTTLVPGDFPKWDKESWGVDEDKQNTSLASEANVIFTSVDRKSIRAIREYLTGDDTAKEVALSFLTLHEKEAKDQRDSLASSILTVLSTPIVRKKL